MCTSLTAKEDECRVFQIAFGIPEDCCELFINGHRGVATNNLKISSKFCLIFDITELYEVLSTEGYWCCLHNNFLVARKGFVYTIFSNGHVNITGLRTHDAARRSVKTLARVLKVAVPCPVYKVDNISASARLKKGVDIYNLSKKTFPNVTIKFNAEVFPGLYFKTSTCTAIVFRTGNVVLVGAKQLFHVHACVHELCKALESV